MAHDQLPDEGVLVTAFEPFGEHETNPTIAAAEAVARECPGVVTEVLPVEFEAATARIRELMDEHQPHTVISLGLAAGRTEITPERVAINVMDAPIPDNSGAQPIDEPVVKGGPAAHFLTLPNKAIVQALKDEGIPASLSNTAGTYVCNAVAYAAAEYAARFNDSFSSGGAVRAGFIHVPAAPGSGSETDKAPSMVQEAINTGIVLAVRTACSTDGDVHREVLGTTDQPFQLAVPLTT
ncbi:pyroglutamyl-peptidase I [Brevibacterium sp. p3-SID960]|uniref:pyroglutamyl-peptidase I n=1 Tax=Brevibacterium sp. p3-SID960 TaxID=2916063 RepID=UPI0021A31AEC|nr:pyroglutamyl-peptidase I [Brevibacterium sp. p3-SID960]MCT1689768.1 pyroglutamyl-peptidase I [Brevibacterium sp. p3-SID960]